MGKLSPTTNDRARRKVEGTLTASNETPWIGGFVGPFNLWIWNLAAGSIALLCSVDGGATSIPVLGPDGQPVIFTAPGRIVIDEPESGVTYRLDATGLTGAANWRFSK